MNTNPEYHHAVSLGFGDVVQVARDFSETGEPELGAVHWGRLYVVGGETSSGSSRDIGIGSVGVSRAADQGTVPEVDKDGYTEPFLDWLGGTENPVAVRVFGTLTPEEMKTLLARGWKHARDPGIALNIYFPPEQTQPRTPRLYAFLADLSFADTPEMYDPQTADIQ